MYFCLAHRILTERLSDPNDKLNKTMDKYIYYLCHSMVKIIPLSSKALMITAINEVLEKPCGKCGPCLK